MDFLDTRILICLIFAISHELLDLFVNVNLNIKYIELIEDLFTKQGDTTFEINHPTSDQYYSIIRIFVKIWSKNIPEIYNNISFTDNKLDEQEKIFDDCIDNFLQINSIETLSNGNTIAIPFKYNGMNTVHIPSDVKLDIKFLMCWCEGIDSAMKRYNNNGFSYNIINYLTTLQNIDDFDISKITKDTFLTEEEFNYYCTIVTINIEHMNANNYTFHFYD
jgi:hypothetical protein